MVISCQSGSRHYCPSLSMGIANVLLTVGLVDLGIFDVYIMYYWYLLQSACEK